MDLKAFFKCNGVLFEGAPLDPRYKNLDSVIGKRVWVCDLGFNDEGDLKPLRNVEPVEVVVCSNVDLPEKRNIYYSPIHFKPVVGDRVLSKIIAPYDNTGYRWRSGTCINIFYTKFDCFESIKICNTVRKCDRRVRTGDESV